MKQKYRIIFFLIGVAGMVIMFLQLDPQNIPWQEVFDVKTVFLFLALFAIWALIYVVHTLSYYVVLGKEGKKINFFALLRICISGFALNSVTPAGLVGGEPYRIMELKKYCSIEKASSSTLTFSLFYIIGHFTLWLTAIALYFILGFASEAYLTVILSISGAFILAVVTLFFLTNKKGITLPFLKFLAKLPLIKKPLTKLIDKKQGQFIEIDDNIIAFRTKKKQYWSVLALQYISRLLEAVEYFIILVYFGAEINYIDAVVIFGIASLIGNIIFFIPMQAGSREGGLFMAIALFGVMESIGSITSIIYRVRDLICIFVGIMIVLINKKEIKKQELTELVEKTDKEESGKV